MSKPSPKTVLLQVCVTAAVLCIPAVGRSQKAPEADKLTIHGFLTQAYAKTDFGQLLGIPEDGTSDYRSLALQLRYAMAENDSFVLQLSHERFGRSPVAGVREEVEVDWAFYQHRFDDGTYIKVGRVPIPIGIYNEFRDVGTLLPFYTPPISIYFDGQLTNEQVDGVVVGTSFFETRAWNLGLDVYTGSWEVVESLEGQIGTASADDALGVQLWLNTPVPGLRFGAGASRYDVSGGFARVSDSDRWEGWSFSIDGNFEHLLARAELYRRKIPFAIQGIPTDGIESEAFYVQLGYRFDEHWALYGQYEKASLDAEIPTVSLTLSQEFWKDLALSVHYAFRPDVVLKVEYHDNEGYLSEDPLFGLFDPPAEINYWITSLSVSF